MLRLQLTLVENARIDNINKIYTIDTINIINHINQYEDNTYDRYDQLTLQPSPTQLHQYCLLFRFALLIKVRSIVVLQPSVILLILSHLLHISLLFATQSYSGTNRRGETALPTRNGLLLCISQSAVSSWIYTTNRTLFLCSRSYQF